MSKRAFPFEDEAEQSSSKRIATEPDQDGAHASSAPPEGPGEANGKPQENGNAGDDHAQEENGKEGNAGDDRAQEENGKEENAGDDRAQEENGKEGNAGDDGAQEENGKEGNAGDDHAQEENGKEGNAGDDHAQEENGKEGNAGDDHAQEENGKEVQPPQAPMEQGDGEPEPVPEAADDPPPPEGTLARLFHGMRAFFTRSEESTMTVTVPFCEICKTVESVVGCSFCEKRICEGCRNRCGRCNEEFCRDCGVFDNAQEDNQFSCLSCLTE